MRTGNKILRQRLKGASVAAYYPRKVATFKDLMKRFPDMESWDDAEEDRLEHVTMYGQPGTIVRRWMLTSCTVSRDVEREHQRRRSLPTVSVEHHEDHFDMSAWTNRCTNRGQGEPEETLSYSLGQRRNGTVY